MVTLNASFVTGQSVSYTRARLLLGLKMSHKAEKILDAASQLFLEQGYRGTNMQTIADNCKMSKGAIYLHFKSKEQILIALLKRMDDHIFAKLASIESDASLSKREVFKAQLKSQIDLSAEHKHLSDLFVNDVSTFSDDFYTFAGETRHRWQLAQKRAVVTYFGEPVLPWLVDVSLIISGMLNEYASYLFLEKIDLPLDPLVEMVVFASEHIVQGLIEQQPVAVLNQDMLPNADSLELDAQARHQKKLQKVIKELSSLVPTQSPLVDDTEFAALSATNERLMQLLEEDEPDLITLRALLASMREYPALQETRREIADLFAVKHI